VNTLYLLPILLSLFFCKPTILSNEANSIIMGIPSDPYSMDPIFSTDLSSRKLNLFLFSRLFQNYEGKVKKTELVKSYSWDIENHHPILNIELGEVRFASGNYLSSSDVYFSLTRLREENSPRKSDYSFLKSFKIRSDRKITIYVDKINDKYLELLSNTFASIYEASNFQKDKSFISCGPYVLKNWDRNDRIVLLRNPFGIKKNLPEKIIFRILPQSSSGVFLFRKKSLDTFKIPFFLVNEFQHTGTNIVKKKGNSIQYIAINNSNPCFDKNFRKALNYSIDKRLIITKLLDNHADLLYSALPPSYYLGLYGEPMKYSYEYDFQKAVELLKESKCFPEIQRKVLEFRMRGDDENKAIGLAIQKNLKDIGIITKILQMEKIQLYKENGEGKGDLTLLTWYLDSESALNYLDPLFSSSNFGNGGNRAFYNNEKVQKSIQSIRLGSNIDKNILKETFNVIEEDAPWVFLWSNDDNYILSEKANQYSDLENFL